MATLMTSTMPNERALAICGFEAKSPVVTRPIRIGTRPICEPTRAVAVAYAAKALPNSVWLNRSKPLLPT